MVYYTGSYSLGGGWYDGLGASFPSSGGGGLGGGGAIDSRSPSPTTPSAPPPVSVGITDVEYAALLYGKSIPLWIGGKSLIGCRVIEGPFFSTITGETTVSGIAAACVPANYANNTRRITALRMSGKMAWTGTANSSGVTTTSTPLSGLNVGGATSGTEQRIRFMYGTNTQSPDASSVKRYGANAQAYNPLVCVVFDNIKTAPFGNVVPFFSVLLEDTQFGTPSDGITWDEAVNTLASFDGRSAHFQSVDLTGRFDALILGNPTTFTDFLSAMRDAKPHWSIRTADKLYLIEKGPYNRDLQINIDKIVKNEDKPIVIVRGDAMAQPRELIYQFIDSNRDYEPSTVYASEDIDATPSFQTSNITVPVVTTAIEASVDANLAFYFKETARQSSQYIGNEDYYGIEPGDVHEIPTAARTYFNAVSQITRNPDFTVDVKSNGFLTCGISGTFYKSLMYDESCHQYTVQGTVFTDADWVMDETPTATFGDDWSEEAIAAADGDYLTTATISTGDCIVYISYAGGVTGSWSAASNQTLNFTPKFVSISGGASKILLLCYTQYDPGTGITHSDGSYLQISTDRGVTFTDTGTNLGYRKWNTSCFAAGAQIMYAASSGNYIAKSSDGGATWADLTGSPNDATNATYINNAQRIRCSRDGSVVIYNCGYTGKVYLSTDGGATWTNPLSLGASATRADCGVSADGSVLIVTNSVTDIIYFSTDGGSTWSSVDPETLVPGRAPSACNVSQDGQCFIVGFLTDGTHSKIATSFDQGATWTISSMLTGLEWVTAYIFDQNFVP